MDKTLTLIAHYARIELTDSLSAAAGTDVSLKIEKNHDRLLNLLSSDQWGTLLFDLSLYDENPEHPCVTAIFKEGRTKKILVMTKQSDKLTLYRLFSKGARGFCSPDISPDHLSRALTAMENGEFWIGRKLTAYFMARLHMNSSAREAQMNIGPRISQTELTLREIEIANSVARGNCDKLVARDLGISPNTVKNHMRNIYRKLNVSDRFQLALLCHGLDVGEEQARNSIAS